MINLNFLNDADVEYYHWNYLIDEINYICYNPVEMNYHLFSVEKNGDIIQTILSISPEGWQEVLLRHKGTLTRISKELFIYQILMIYDFV